MFRKTLPISALLLLACNGVPSRPMPGDYQPEAVTIRARFLDLPAGAISAGPRVYQMDRYKKSFRQVPTGSDVSLTTDEVEFHLAAIWGLSPEQYQLPDLRFFRVLVMAAPPYAPDRYDSIYPGSWEDPGRFLVYAMNATFWTPLGPNGPTLNFPQGYSWLRRRCGTTPGQIEMEVRPIDEVVELRHQDTTDPEQEDSDLEMSERALVEGCGATIPAADLGVRASFDVASSLAWSPDGTTIYYLSRPDEQDKTQTAGLRQVRLLDSSTSELTTIAKATGVQVGKPGHLFVSTSDSLLHVTLAPTVTAVPVLNVEGSTGVVSPDGQWLAYGDGRTHIIDLDTGTPLAGFEGPRGAPDRWSSDGRLAYWVFDEGQTSLNTLSLAAPSDVPSTYPAEQGIRTNVVWTRGGVMLTKTLGAPLWVEGASTVYVGDFGLTLADPATGITTPLLDATAGTVSSVPRTPFLDKAFAWTRKCLGPWTTVCSDALVRIDAVQATGETIATWSISVPVAISSDGRRLALGTSKGIYVKELPQ
jgi:hypothetical protein